MTLADTALAALSVTLPLAILAAVLGAFSWGGAAGGLVVAGVISAAHGLPGLGVLLLFVAAGSAATHMGYRVTAAGGAAEAGGGRRGARRVLGKGAVATALAGAALAGHPLPAAFCGALAAALADTLGTEVGALVEASPRLPPGFGRVPAGTPGAVSLPGVGAGVLGGALVGVAAAATGLLSWHAVGWMAGAGALGALVESVATGALPPVAAAPGWVRNLLSTGAGALLAHLAAGWAP